MNSQLACCTSRQRHFLLLQPAAQGMQAGNLSQACGKSQCTPRLLAGASLSQFPDDLELCRHTLSSVVQLWVPVSDIIWPDLALAADHSSFTLVTPPPVATFAIFADCSIATLPESKLSSLLRLLFASWSTTAWAALEVCLLRLRSLGAGYDYCDAVCCPAVQA